MDGNRIDVHHHLLPPKYVEIVGDEAAIDEALVVAKAALGAVAQEND